MFTRVRAAEASCAVHRGGTLLEVRYLARGGCFQPFGKRVLTMSSLKLHADGGAARYGQTSKYVYLA